jgi:Xaa-Pro aminopeptidase
MSAEKIRLARVRERFQFFEIDAFYVTKPENVWYLSHFPGGDSFLLITRRHCYFITDTRYEAEARAHLSAGYTLQVKTSGQTNASIVEDICKKERLRHLGFEPECLTVAQYRHLRQTLGKSIQLKPSYRVVEPLRLLKTPEEVKIIHRACEIMEQSLRKALRELKIGTQEREFSSKVEANIKKMGASGPSFPFIIASGKKAAFPHAQTGTEKIANNNILLCDVGARYQAYASDLTRTHFLGKMSVKFGDLYQTVLEAQQAGIRSAQVGAPIGVVDLAVRKVFRSKGLEKYFNHSTGHGIGLEVHESPSVFYKNDQLIQDGMVFTVEPGLYFPGWGGIRIEDIIHITSRGPRLLYTYPSDLKSIHLN